MLQLLRGLIAKRNIFNIQSFILSLGMKGYHLPFCGFAESKCQELIRSFLQHLGMYHQRWGWHHEGVGHLWCCWVSICSSHWGGHEREFWRWFFDEMTCRAIVLSPVIQPLLCSGHIYSFGRLYHCHSKWATGSSNICARLEQSGGAREGEYSCSRSNRGTWGQVSSTV